MLGVELQLRFLLKTIMNTQPLFSIIVPVYQTERFLEQCLRSLKNQSLRDFECIVVNDGSKGTRIEDWYRDQDTDWKSKLSIVNIENQFQCRYIFHQIVGDDLRFKYVEQSNKGVSVARNTAIKLATGKHIVCVDSDDWILPNHLDNIVNVIEKQKNQPNFTFSLITRAYNTGRTIKRPIPRSFNLANLTYSHFAWSWNSVYSLDFLQKYGLVFDEKLGYGAQNFSGAVSVKKEDVLFSYDHFYALHREYNLKHVRFVDYLQTYMYRDVAKAEKKALDDMLNGEQAFLRYLHNKYENEDIPRSAKIALASQYPG
ncbi:hypothetical protein DP113_16180 [Brasilonema octagenarum UFV-E1]|uniref:Glycosyltransferase 2-like domain-containing protein n=2 Tax=Bromeliae group (in: Brasilonema) TaxID=3398495 RepID=A0A856MF23_9CYAN|nr:hypothetical protein DP114_16245 [Brasilonema sennae CENA114]QDL15601.1 hypothetical protein DP113_16180 [Brasilonema octagenarum UFV-E1]